MATFKIVVDLTWAGTGGPGVNVFHMRAEEGDPFTASVQDGVDALQAMYAGLANNLPSSMVCSVGSEVIEDPYGSPKYKEVTGWSVTGSGGANYLPLATAIVIGWRSESATRSGRGRTFIGPLSTNVLEANGSLNTDAVNDFRLAGTNLVNISKGWTQAAFGVYSPTDGVLRDFESSAVQDRFAVLRSRRD